MIISRTPYRVSLVGGGSDYPEYYESAPNGGAVIALAINRHCYVSVRHLPPYFGHRHRIVYSRVETVSEVREIQHPLVRAALSGYSGRSGVELHHDGDVPAGSGLGTSSSFAVGLVNALAALQGRRLTQDQLTTAAIHLERVGAGDAVGCQDQAMAAWGGLRKISFQRGNSPVVYPLILPPERERELLTNLMLVYTGSSRRASEVAADQLRRVEENRLSLDAVRARVTEVEALFTSVTTSNRYADLGAIIEDTWYRKRELSPLVSTPEIDTIYDAAISAGAYGGKLLGAGGGGFMLLVVPPERRHEVKTALRNLVEVPIEIDRTGSTIVLYEPDGLGGRL